MRTTEAGIVPDSYYGPGTLRWATPEEVHRFGLNNYPLVGLDKNGEIDCYFTTTKAVVLGGTDAEMEEQRNVGRAMPLPTRY
jgi:hypothetical protein